MTFVMTRIAVGDYDAWKALFDQDVPRARESALAYRVFRNDEDPGEVLVQLEFASPEDARTARDRLLASGVLDRFPDRHGPTVMELAEAVVR